MQQSYRFHPFLKSNDDVFWRAYIYESNSTAEILCESVFVCTEELQY